MNDWDYIHKLGGEGILSRQDVQDLKGQRAKVLWLMLDGNWHSSQEILDAAGGSEGMRRLRELREIPNVTIERKRGNLGRVFFYRLRLSMGLQQDLFEEYSESELRASRKAGEMWETILEKVKNA